MPNRFSIKKRKNVTSVSSDSPTKTPKAFSLKRLRINLRSYALWTSVMLVAGVAILGAGLYVWYNQIFINQDRIFYGMIDESLQTDSILRQVNQDASGRTEVQNYFLTFTPNPVVQTSSDVEQVAQNREISRVSTETIGTRDTDYVRYTKIEIPPTSGQPADYSKVTGQWAERSSDPEQGQSAQFLNEAIFTFIPFGNFNDEQRAELIQMIKDEEVYKFSGDGKITYSNARPIYNTQVSIKPRGLVTVLKKYAELTGIGDMAQLDPSQYDDKHSFGINVQVDMLTRHLRQIGYPNESRVENYLSYGLNRSIEVPNEVISLEELQGRLEQNQAQ